MSHVLVPCARQARWFAILMAGVLTGCGGAPKPPELGETVKVTGVVTLDGKPFAGAGVKFHPLGERGFQGATGMTDADGKYELGMIVGVKDRKPGVVPGKYKVTVSRWRLKDDRPMTEAKGDPLMDGAHETAPAATASPDTTLLWYEVPAGGGSYDITLTAN